MDDSTTVSGPVKPEIRLDRAGRLQDELPCRRCGYTLRGLPLTGNCPECETSVGRSVHGDLLRYSDPDWMERIARGARLFAILTIVSVVVLIGIVTALGLLTISGTTISSYLFIPAVLVLGVLTVLQVYAAWLVTTPDPGIDESEKPVNARVVARVGLVLGTILSHAVFFIDPEIGQILSTSSAVQPPTTSLSMQLTVWCLTLIAAAVNTAGLFGLFLYAASIARRIPDDKLARRTRLVMWGMLVPTMISQTLTLIQEAILAGGGMSPTFETVFGLGMFAVSLPALVFGIWGLVLIFIYRSRLLKAAKSARAAWSSPTIMP